jgi:dihydrofolate reductase
MRAIIGMNNLGFIGIGNRMLWHSPDDFKHFKQMTMGGRLLVGYNTSLELPPLKGREVVIDTRGIWYIPDIESIDWCIGGKKTYEKYCHMFTELHISHIDDNSIGDVVFPDFSNLNPGCEIFNYHFKSI